MKIIYNDNNYKIVDSEKGYYVIKYKDDDGKWKFVMDIGNVPQEFRDERKAIDTINGFIESASIQERWNDMNS